MSFIWKTHKYIRIAELGADVTAQNLQILLFPAIERMREKRKKNTGYRINSSMRGSIIIFLLMNSR